MGTHPANKKQKLPKIESCLNLHCITAATQNASYLLTALCFWFQLENNAFILNKSPVSVSKNSCTITPIHLLQTIIGRPNGRNNVFANSILSYVGTFLNPPVLLVPSDSLRSPALYCIHLIKVSIVLKAVYHYPTKCKDWLGLFLSCNCLVTNRNRNEILASHIYLPTLSLHEPIALYCIVSYFILLYCFALHCILLYCIVSYFIVLYCIVLHCIVFYCIVLYCTVLYCIVLYCIVLHCIVLYCILLYYIVL